MSETIRLTTRKLTIQDADTGLEFMQGVDSLEFAPYAGPTLEESKLWIERQLSRYEKDGYGMMALIHKETGEMVGQSGILIQDVEGR